MPLTVLQVYAAQTGNDRLNQLGFLMSFSGGVSLFPLLFRTHETCLKLLLFAIYHAIYYTTVKKPP